MKKVLLIVFSIFACISIEPIQAQGFTYTPFFNVTSRNLFEVILDDGIYEVQVEYQSHTQHRAVYKLMVKIQNDNITQIYFGDGGSVHTGYNNSGYTWRGGGIQWTRNWDGTIIGGKAVIQITYTNSGWQLFTIRF